jgi:hypothetical protein
LPRSWQPIFFGVPTAAAPRRKLPLRVQVRVPIATGTITLLLEKVE